MLLTDSALQQMWSAGLGLANADLEHHTILNENSYSHFKGTYIYTMLHYICFFYNYVHSNKATQYSLIQWFPNILVLAPLLKLTFHQDPESFMRLKKFNFNSH